MDGYVAKPIKPVELFEVIDRVMTAAGSSQQAAGSSGQLEAGDRDCPLPAARCRLVNREAVQ